MKFDFALREIQINRPEFIAQQALNWKATRSKRAHNAQSSKNVHFKQKLESLSAGIKAQGHLIRSDNDNWMFT